MYKIRIAIILNVSIALKIVFFQELIPAIRYNLCGRTPATKDFHCYRGYGSCFSVQILVLI